MSHRSYSSAEQPHEDEQLLENTHIWISEFSQRVDPDDLTDDLF